MKLSGFEWLILPAILILFLLPTFVAFAKQKSAKREPGEREETAAGLDYFGRLAAQSRAAAAAVPGDGTPWKRTIASVLPSTIVYQDSKGAETTRTILPTAILGRLQNETVTAISVRAFCTMANAPRTFKISRIKDVINPETGEVLSVEHWVRALVER